MPRVQKAPGLIPSTQEMETGGSEVQRHSSGLRVGGKAEILKGLCLKTKHKQNPHLVYLTLKLPVFLKGDASQFNILLLRGQHCSASPSRESWKSVVPRSQPT